MSSFKALHYKQRVPVSKEKKCLIRFDKAREEYFVVEMSCSQITTELSRSSDKSDLDHLKEVLPAEICRMRR